MAEFENETIEDINDDIEEIENDDNDDEITYDQAMEYKRKAEGLSKAEKKIIELKKQLKEKEATPSNLSEQDLDLRDELSEFLANNADLKEYKSELLKYRKDGFTMKQAKALVEADDKTIENRKKINSMNVTNGENSEKTTYTTSDLENMSQANYNKIMALKEQGKVTIRR